MENNAKTHVYNSAVTPDAAANAAEDGYRRKYPALTIQFRLEPVALEVAEVFSKTTEVLLKQSDRLIGGNRRLQGNLLDREK